MYIEILNPIAYEECLAIKFLYVNVRDAEIYIQFVEIHTENDTSEESVRKWS